MTKITPLLFTQGSTMARNLGDTDVKVHVQSI